MRNRIRDDVQIVFAEVRALDPDGLDLTFVRTGVRELEMLLDAVHHKNIRVEFEPALFPDNALKLLCTLEFRGTLRKEVEKTFVRLVEPFEDLLDGLAVQTATTDTLRKMSLHPRTGTKFPRQGVVPFL